MNPTLQIILYVSVYILGIIVWSVYFSRKQSQEDFLIGSRNRGWLSIGMSKYATSIGASWFITYTAYIYEFGVGVFAFVLGYFIAMLLLGYYIGPKLHNISKKHHFLGIGDIIYYMTQSKKIARLGDMIASISLFLWILVTIVAGANLIHFLGILSYEWSLVSLILIVLIYTLNIGYKGVIITDILQASIICIILTVMAMSLFSTTDISALRSVSFDQLNMGTFAGFLIYGIFSAFSFVDRYQLLFSAKNAKHIKKGFLLVIPLMLVSLSLLLLMGYVLKGSVDNIDPSMVFLRGMELYIPPALFPLAIVMFFAAIMSSLDSTIHGISSNIRVFPIKNVITQTRVNTLLIAILVLIICYFTRDIIELTVFASGFSLILSVSMIYLLFGKHMVKYSKRPSRLMFSIIGSLIGLFGGIMLFGVVPMVAIFPIIFGAFGLIFAHKNMDTYFSKL